MLSKQRASTPISSARDGQPLGGPLVEHVGRRAREHLQRPRDRAREQDRENHRRDAHQQHHPDDPLAENPGRRQHVGERARGAQHDEAVAFGVAERRAHERRHLARQRVGLGEPVERHVRAHPAEQQPRGRKAVLHQHAPAAIEAEGLRRIGMHDEVAPLVRHVHRIVLRQVALQPFEHARQLDVDHQRADDPAVQVDHRRAHPQHRQPFGFVRTVLVIDADRRQVDVAGRRRERVEDV
jgi:hypothetical protein